MENQMFEAIYERFIIEFQLRLNRPLFDDEKKFIEWVSMKAIEEYKKIPI
ncbi:hypothetical protein [Pseudalkalibacillus decolorationis]|nr:hypothetical protein [Pseudalkalibacillus decolorationis]